jgi:hypothetical protein
MRIIKEMVLKLREEQKVIPEAKKLGTNAKPFPQAFPSWTLSCKRGSAQSVATIIG